MGMAPVWLGLEPIAERDPADNRAKIKKARCHRGHSEDMLRIQHSHRQRGEGYKQNEWKHNAREQNGESRFLIRKTGCKNFDQHGRKENSEQGNRAHEYERQGGDFAGQLPG